MMESSLTCKLLDLEDQEDDLATLSSRSDDEESCDDDDDSVLDEEILEECLQNARSGSAAIGFLIGLFIQGSTLGLNFLVASIAGEDDPTLETYVNMTVLWSVFAASLAVSILFLMRSLMVSAFYSTNDPDSYDIEQKEHFMGQLISTIEKMYAVGALGGVGVAWCATDILLDVKSHLVHSLLTFVVATLWYSCS